MKNIVCIAFLSVTLLAGSAHAEQDPWARLRAEAATIKTIQADFEQHKTLRILKRPLVSRGRFFFASPGSARWEYTAPLRTVTLVHGGKVQRYAAGRHGKLVKDASSNLEAMRVVLEQMTGWLSGKFGESAMFSAKLEPGEAVGEGAKPRPKVVLAPKEEAMKRFIQRVELHFSKTPGVVHQVTIIEGKGSTTRITFAKPRVNKPLPKKVFESVK